jgi:hypothetical protein
VCIIEQDGSLDAPQPRHSRHSPARICGAFLLRTACDKGAMVPNPGGPANISGPCYFRLRANSAEFPFQQRVKKCQLAEAETVPRVRYGAERFHAVALALTSSTACT